MTGACIWVPSGHMSLIAPILSVHARASANAQVAALAVPRPYTVSALGRIAGDSRQKYLERTTRTMERTTTVRLSASGPSGLNWNSGFFPQAEPLRHANESDQSLKEQHLRQWH